MAISPIFAPVLVRSHQGTFYPILSDPRACGYFLWDGAEVGGGSGGRREAAWRRGQTGSDGAKHKVVNVATRIKHETSRVAVLRHTVCHLVDRLAIQVLDPVPLPFVQIRAAVGKVSEEVNYRVELPVSVGVLFDLNENRRALYGEELGGSF